MVEVVCCSGLGRCIISLDELPDLMQITKTSFPSSMAGSLGVSQAGEEMDSLNFSGCFLN